MKIAQEIRAGNVVMHDKNPMVVLKTEYSRGGRNAATVRMKMKNLISGSGAEVVAGGSIHVYGTLRGRALAGAAGNSRARIFCRRIEAELVAIDGYYRTAVNLDAKLRERPVQAWLAGETLMIEAMD